MAGELAVGDRIEMRHGPFVATWTVVELIGAGARLEYHDDVVFVGYPEVQHAPNGDQLTRAPEQEFIGRAHWHEFERVNG